MFRPALLVALFLSLTLDLFAPVRIDAYTEDSATPLVSDSLAAPFLSSQPFSESSVLLVIGIALISLARVTRR